MNPLDTLEPLDLQDNSQDKLSPWAEAIFLQKYAMEKADGSKETWGELAERVAGTVLRSLGYTEDSSEVEALTELIRSRKFIPGGRYLYATGRPYHNTNNCFLLRAVDSREGWADLLKKSALILQTGGGVGIEYSDIRPCGAPIKKTGGMASGPLPLAQMINEIGRGVMQGGSRRSAVIGLLKWDHEDCPDFIRMKNWSEEVRALKAKDPNFPATLDMTNISVRLDDEFFDAFNDEYHPKHELAQTIYYDAVANMVTTGEPGFSIDSGNSSREVLRNPCITKENHVLTALGYKRVEELLDEPNVVWTGKQWATDVVFRKTKNDVSIFKVSFSGGRSIRCDETHEFFVERWEGAGFQRRLLSIDKVPAAQLESGDVLHISAPIEPIEKEINQEGYTLGWIYGDGSFCKAGGADLTLCGEAKKACAPSLVGYNSMNESDYRGHTRVYFSVSEDFSERSKDNFPEDLYEREDSFALSFLAGLWDADGNVNPNRYSIRLANKSSKFLRGVARLLEQYGIYGCVSKNGRDGRNHVQQYQLVIEQGSVTRFLEIVPTQRCSMELQSEYQPYRQWKAKVIDVVADGTEDVYCANVGAEEHSFMCEGVIISNCSEVCSEDDSDVCCLGSINIAKIDTIEEFEEIVDWAILFLLGGTVYSDVPYREVDDVRQKNRRLGLGIMGVHEWLLKRSYRYGPTPELADWLSVYATSTTKAHRWADKLGLSRPIKTRAIAPTGSLSILGETTSGIEPIFCAAYKRRFKSSQPNGKDIIKYQYVIDPTAKRLVENGVNTDDIEDAYTLSYDVERRIRMQAWVNRFVDMGISSTINLPYPITDEDEMRDFANTLYPYLPNLRGITAYPDGSRDFQPLESVPYAIAASKEGVTIEENSERACKSGVCGA